ncbi:MAG: ComF family protein [Candidatus Omnitrophica bacterium]|nr:ComF family protein [Candidatus Omnitrophota bacterium]
MPMLSRMIKGLLDFVYPKVCLGCKNKIKVRADNNFVCPDCWTKIKKNLPPFCHSCGRRLDKSGFSKSICPGCLKKKLHFDRAFSPCVYDGVVKELIHEFKYKGKDYLGPLLSRLMIDFIKEYNLPMDCLDFIIPIPLHKARLREREFNQAEILAKAIAKEFNKHAPSDLLLRHRHTKTQTELETDQRLCNVQGSFAVTRLEDIIGKNILLVDDVLTTGATSSEAALTLKDAGANIVFVLTLAN